MQFSPWLAPVLLQIDDYAILDQLLTGLLWTVGGFVGLWLLMTAALLFLVVGVRFTNYQYVDDPGAISRAVAATGGDWLSRMGFEPEGVIHPIGISTALFRHRESRAAIAVYFASDNMIIEVTSEFPNGVNLETSNTIDNATVPTSIGTIIQCLPSGGIDEQWQAHREAVALLRQQCNIDEIALGPLNEAVRDSAMRQSNYLFSRPWLILTSPYRYFVTRNKYRDVTVAAQMDRGWIDPRAVSDIARGYDF